MPLNLKTILINFTRVFSPNLKIPSSEVDKLWRSFSENKMSPDNVTFSFSESSTGNTVRATYSALEKEAKKRNVTMDSLIDTLFTDLNANVDY
jgi:hypothetical protein